jgi:hypothetical protein
MLNTIVVLVLVAAVLWVLWNLWQNGWDLKKAGTAIAAAAVAAWLWVSDFLTALTSGL